MNLSKDEKKIIEKLRQEQEIKKDKKYIETSKKLMFAIMLLVFIVFFICLYLSLKLNDSNLASHTLDRAVIFSAPVLTALITKSGLENRQKGKIREQIIKKMDNVELGAEDFRNGV
ncbi:hypothetical protein HMPREF9629_00602 [Peptoanaerobacter stomatis]|uniref:Uncharacterized protein n=1 Tax=Peptoanaerobacter stomatis TaxID=796937 RepID=G9X2J5_9FIRM|nr:hypothetical protein [Peptoanaerobacter stomatis]EHL11065.1 hypothetical protein HMPREF9629_00602 [Peptoanaerobacter stomatis]